MAATGKGKGFSITEEELAAQTLDALKARAEELGCPLSQEDAVAVGEMMKSADTATLPTSQAEIDEKLGEVRMMPKEAFEQMMAMVKTMAAKGKGKGCSITDDGKGIGQRMLESQKKFKTQLIGVLKARAEELGCPMSQEDVVVVGEVMNEEKARSASGIGTSGTVGDVIDMFKEVPKAALEALLENCRATAKGGPVAELQEDGILVKLAAKGKGKGLTIEPRVDAVSDGPGFTFVNMAVFFGSPEDLAAAIAAGVDKEKGVFGKSPLTLIIENESRNGFEEQQAKIQVLIDAGADLTKLNHNMTPLATAKQGVNGKRPELVGWMESKGFVLSPEELASGEF